MGSERVSIFVRVTRLTRLTCNARHIIAGASAFEIG